MKAIIVDSSWKKKKTMMMMGRKQKICEAAEAGGWRPKNNPLVCSSWWKWKSAGVFAEAKQESERLFLLVLVVVVVSMTLSLSLFISLLGPFLDTKKEPECPLQQAKYLNNDLQQWVGDFVHDSTDSDSRLITWRFGLRANDRQSGFPFFGPLFLFFLLLPT